MDGTVGDNAVIDTYELVDRLDNALRRERGGGTPLSRDEIVALLALTRIWKAQHGRPQIINQ